MRARLCIAAGSSTSSAMSSSRTAAARGRRPRGRGFCEGPRSRDRCGRGGEFLSGNACWRTVSEDISGNHGGFGGDTSAPGPLTGPPPDPVFRFRSPYPGPRPLPAPPYGTPLPRHSWQPPPPAFGPQHPPVYGPPPRRNPLQASLWEFRPPPRLRPRPADYRSWVPSSLTPPPPVFGPQHPPVYGPPPRRNPLQAPLREFSPLPPRLRPRPADYRNWVPSSLPPPPPECERFKVLSYNILADYLARDHQSKLYFHIPSELLNWEWRKSRLLIEFGLWSPDIMCLQEVDKFQDLGKELTRYGYSGIWKMRTGNAVDGCAVFWQTHRFVLRHEEHIEFAKLGLRDNVAQICVLESRSQNPADNSEALSARSSLPLKPERVVVCNIHVLYNPKRGEIKLGQVRVLLDQAYSVSKIWNDAPVIICGDFNSIPKSPLYNFISGQKLNLSGLDRNEISGQYSACIYPPRPSTGSGLYRGHPPHDINDGRPAPVELDNHQSGVKDHHITQKNVESALLADSEKLCTYSQLENEMGSEFDATSGVEDDRLDRLPLCKEKDSLNVAVKDSTESSKVLTFTESERVENLTSTNASSQRYLHTADEMQSDDKPANDSTFIVETISKHDEQVNNQHFVSSGNKGMSHGHLHSLSEVKIVSSIHMSCTFTTMQEDIIDFNMEKNTSNSGPAMLPFEGNRDVFSPENDLENSMESKSESNKFHDDLESKSGSDEFSDDVSLGKSTYQRISKAFTLSVGTSLPESIEPSAGLISGERTADLDVSYQNSYKHNPLDSSNILDTHLDLEEFDSLLNDANEVMKNVSSGSDQFVVEAHERLPGVTEDIGLQGIIYSNSSTQYSGSGDAAFSTAIEIEASPYHTVEEVNSDSSFLEELHGKGNAPDFSEGVSVMSLSNQTMSPIFPDPFMSQGVGEEEVESGRLNSNMAHQSPEPSKIWEKVYNPFLWTSMEIEAASGNAECNFLEHNLNLTSAYTEVKDYVGTKDSSGEPQVTSYNRQFMGTVDYIWHSEELQTVQVLDTIPSHVLQRTSGFPTKKWGSDHLALACEFAFKKA